MYSGMSAARAAEMMMVDPHTGLTEDQVRDRRKIYGENRLEKQKSKPIAVKFMYQFSDPMVIILIVAAIVSFATEWMKGEPDFIDPVIIMGIVVMNACIGVFQENKAEKALEELKDILSPTAAVRREGQIINIPVEEIVPGDILIIETGDVIPADCRLLQNVSLIMDESALTGESKGVKKDADLLCPEDTPLGDKKNMVWSATSVSAGRGEALVTAIGMNTEVGGIAGILISHEVSQTPLQQKLAKTGQTLGIGALIICGIIFAVGLFKAMPPMDMFLTAVSLAVAAIPEGLPAVVTVMLAIGVQRMAYNRAIIRRLSAVETLGSASVICSDKTGTITQNRMKVKEWWNGSREGRPDIRTGGEDLSGRAPESISSSPESSRPTPLARSLDDLFLCAALCNNGTGQTEQALVKGAEEKGFSKKEWDARYPRISENPFDSGKKWMGTVHRFPSGEYSMVKGAPDVVIEMCNLNETQRREILKKNSEMAARALRVIAFARGGSSDYNNLEFLGLAGIYDPPRKEAATSIETCKGAGIKVVMITGDHEETAAAIATEVGLLQTPEGRKLETINGKALAALTDEQLERKIENYGVFARVSPKEKARIVKAYQKRGHIVAMTGDGVNDAPALKFADIGCAMGISGTAVARGAADMVLADDNFATIVTAVREGRGIYDNIKKAVHFLLSSNIGEIITIFVAILLGWNSPLLPVQLLWINLITDSFPAIALGVDPVDPDIMERKPVRKDSGLFADGMTANILIEGVMIGTLALIAFSIGYNQFHSLEVARTMSFTVLGMSQLIHAFNMRSERKSILETGFFSNPYLAGAFLLGLVLQIAVVSLPALSGIFGVVSLSSLQWGIVAMLSVFPLVFVEIEKAALKRLNI